MFLETDNKESSSRTRSGVPHNQRKGLRVEPVMTEEIDYYYYKDHYYVYKKS